MNILVAFYSSTGTIHNLASALAEGAKDAGADVRLRRVAELAPDAAIDSNPAWRAFVDDVAPSIPEVELADLEWADGFAFGTPTRFGGPAAQLKQFIDTTGGLWQQGALADKAATSFTSAINAHGGIEATLLALNNTFYHWGCVLVPPGYTDPIVYAAGGSPYGTGFATGMPAQEPHDGVLAAARYQGQRLAEISAHLRAGRDATVGALA